eukprot:TRINITY_DN820_c0_g1_i1.p1 TRINITY_DN820_c0_g1~~TRINITY_DN820_c0_g1_i1.p1  ORF type:complete len:971 (-),score=142.40 TRINITY_DN820_c0_g1_i1:2261-5173(-)
MAHARLEHKSQQSVTDEHLVQRILEIEKQITPDDYQHRSCFDCTNFPNPALVAFQRFQSASQQRSTTLTGNMNQQNAKGASTARLAPQTCTRDLTAERTLPFPFGDNPMLDAVRSRSSPVEHTLTCASVPPGSVQLKSISSNPKDLQVSSKRRRIMSGRYTYSHRDMWQLRHQNKSLDGRKLGSRAIILLTDGPPAPTQTQTIPNVSFADMYLSQPILRALHSLDFDRPSPIQQAAIPRGRLGGDIIAHAKSGTGKTIAFIIVALESLISLNFRKGGFTSVLILVPTRELVDQVASVFQSLSKFMNPKPRALTVKGGTPEAIDEQQLSLSTPHVVIGTPGRVIMLIQKGVFVIDHINLLVLDEADRLAESSFSHSVPEICEMLPARRQTIAFSATFEPWLRNMLIHVMRNPAFFSFPSSTHANDEVDMLRRAVLDKVSQYKVPVSGSLDAKLDQAAALLSRTSFSLCIVFLNDKRLVAKILMRLKHEGFQAGIMNANLDQRQRDRTLLNVKEGKLQIVVASDLLARGVDFKECDLILQLDVPYNPATYLHRVGRAGRFGRRGSSFLFYNAKSDERNHVSILEKSLGSNITVFDNHATRNRNPLHHPNGLQRTKPLRYTSQLEHIPNPKDFGSRSRQMCEIRGGGHKRAPEDIRSSRRTPAHNVNDDDVRHSSLTPPNHRRLAPEARGQANVLGSNISFDPRINNNFYVRAKNPRTTPEKDRNNLRVTQPKQNKNFPSSMAKDVSRESGSACGMDVEMEKSLLRSPQNPTPSSASGHKTGNLSQREPQRRKCYDSDKPSLEKMIATDEDQKSTVQSHTGKTYAKSSNAPKEIAMADSHDLCEQVFIDVRNKANHRVEPLRQVRSSHGATETTFHEAAAKGAEALQESIHVGESNPRNQRASYPEVPGNSNEQGHPVILQGEEMDICDRENEPSDMWDAYARDAYAAGFREAYEEAYRMGCELQDRLQKAHT